MTSDTFFVGEPICGALVLTLTTLVRPLPRRLLLLILPLPTNLPTFSSPNANEQMFEVGATEFPAMTAMMAQVLISGLRVPVPLRAYTNIYVYVCICDYMQIRIYKYTYVWSSNAHT